MLSVSPGRLCPTMRSQTVHVSRDLARALEVPSVHVLGEPPKRHSEDQRRIN
jgi:hypothetical protein